MTTIIGSDSSGNQKVGLLPTEEYSEDHNSVGGSNQTHNTQITSVQNTSAQHSIQPLSSHQTKKYLQEKSIILQLSKEVTHSQNKTLSSPKLNQQSNKESLSLLTLSQPLPCTPNYPSELQWWDNRRKLTSLLDKLNRKHKESMSSTTLAMVLLKGTHHPSSLETEAQPGSS